MGQSPTQAAVRKLFVMLISSHIFRAGVLLIALTAGGYANAFDQSGSGDAFGTETSDNPFEGASPDSSDPVFHIIVPPSAAQLGDAVSTPESDLEAYRDGIDAYRKGNYAGARKKWARLADGGDVFAQWRLGNMYRTGLGVDKSSARAFKYYRMCAEQHKETTRYTEHTRVTVDCYVRLARYFESGVKAADIRKNVPHALKLYKFTATHFGHPGAQYSIGRMYLKGTGVAKNVSKGLRWLNLSARKKYAPAQAALGEVYWSGKGVRVNRAKGLMWYMLAQQNADPDLQAPIIDRFQALYSSTDGEERSKAETLVSGWNKRQSSRGKNP